MGRRVIVQTGLRIYCADRTKTWQPQAYSPSPQANFNGWMRNGSGLPELLRRMVLAGIILCLLFCFGGCGANGKPDSAAETSKANGQQGGEAESPVQMNQSIDETYTAKTKISDVMANPVFENYGRLIFPVNEGYYSGGTLGDLRLTWYSNIDPKKTVEIANYMKDHAASGDTIFFDIYTDEEKAADPEKENTGLSHGFGLGTETAAEGWIENAIAVIAVIGMRLLGGSSHTAIDNNPETEVSGDSKVLIAYFSWSGNGQQMARWISKETGGELFRIVPEESYGGDYETCADRAKNELDNEIRPELSSHIDADIMAQYDVIYLGFPVWWYDLPMPVWTFPEEYNLEGKTIIPFFSHNGSANGANSVNRVSELAKDAVILSNDALSLRGSDVNDSETEVKEWAAGFIN